MLDINRVPLTKDGNKIDYWATLSLNNEKIQCDFIHDGEVFFTVNNLQNKATFGIMGMIVYLHDNKGAEREVSNMIDSFNKSEYSALKGLTVLGGKYHGL